MPSSTFHHPEKYQYLSGFNCYHESEAIPGTLPVGMNSPQKAPYGLYAEKLSGTAFTAPRFENQQSWLYRILPSVTHSRFEPVATGLLEDESTFEQVPNQLRWDPFDLSETNSWTDSLRPVAGAGSPVTKTGLAIHVFSVGRDMRAREAFYNSDGDFLIVPQLGVLDIQTEMGHLLVRPREICVIPRGVRYRVSLPAGPARGYILELYQNHFALPELGPLGTNALANIRDFQGPVAAYEDDRGGAPGAPWSIITKFSGKLFEARQPHTPFDVVGWHGNYYPYKYDLGRFNTMGSISFDHPDPSIFTVLTAPSDRPGTAVADFVVFPPRWLVQADTFRPPYFHRNCMSEFMGLIAGEYDGKDGAAFRPGGASLHNVMSAHGPDAATFERASSAGLEPEWVGGGSLAFMFESAYMVGVTRWGLKTCQKVQPNYNADSWGGLRRAFCPPAEAATTVNEGSREGRPNGSNGSNGSNGCHADTS